MKGHPTTWGAKPYAGQVFDDDARVIEKLDKAGAILIGKLAMVELAGGGGYRYPGGIAHGAGIESVGSHALERRIVQRIGSGDGGGAGDVRDRIGNVGLDSDAELATAASRDCGRLTDW